MPSQHLGSPKCLLATNHSAAARAPCHTTTETQYHSCTSKNYSAGRQVQNKDLTITGPGLRLLPGFKVDLYYLRWSTHSHLFPTLQRYLLGITVSMLNAKIPRIARRKLWYTATSRDLVGVPPPLTRPRHPTCQCNILPSSRRHS